MHYFYSLHIKECSAKKTAIANGTRTAIEKDLKTLP